jgi:hypothetical protein
MIKLVADEIGGGRTWRNFPERYLEKGRELYEAGVKSELLNCLFFCLRSDPPVPVPAWLRNALEEAYLAGFSYQIKSWDEVFGRPIKKGWSDSRLAAERRKNSIAWDVFEAVCARMEAGDAISQDLFASVGKQFGVGSTVAHQLYYRILDRSRTTEADLINRIPPAAIQRRVGEICVMLSVPDLVFAVIPSQTRMAVGESQFSKCHRRDTLGVTAGWL